MQRTFTAAAPDRLQSRDITQRRTGQGWSYLAVVLDVLSRRAVGWAWADHLRAELVVDALPMAIWQRRPPPGAIYHSDHGSQYTSWSFGHRLREAGLLGSMGSIGDCFGEGLAESFVATLQTEPLDRHAWATTSWPTPCLATSRACATPPPALRPRLPQASRLRDRVASTTTHHRSKITTPAHRNRPETGGTSSQRCAVECPAPGLMEALNPREDESHGGT